MISKTSYRFVKYVLLLLNGLTLYQCSIPAFEGLLPEPHNTRVLELLYTMVHWHGLAKLRMHHEQTLQIMDAVTVSVGEKLRRFTLDTCASFATKELPREYNSRLRRQAAKASSKRQVKTGAGINRSGDAEVRLSRSVNSNPHPRSGSSSRYIKFA